MKDKQALEPVAKCDEDYLGVIKSGEDRGR
jgi:hypothetical protein